MKAHQWFRIQNVADDSSVAEIFVFDIIGDWIDDLFGWGGVTTAKTFGDELAKLSDAVKTIRVHINSPGGDVFSALAIANMLREQQTSKGRSVETIVDGLAASAASIVMMAGRTVRIADNALVMIHNPWTVAIGNADEMLKAAEELDTVRNTIIATYKWHSEMDDKAIGKLMDSETWMSADEALANGFATEKVEGLKAAASIDRRALAKLAVPERYRARVDALLKPEQSTEQPTAAAAQDVLRICREGGCLDLAEGFITAKASLDDVTAGVTREKGARAQAAQRESEIRALCAKAKLPDLADGYVNGAMSVADVKAHLTTVTAKLDKAEIDANLPPDQGQQPADSWKKAFAKAKGNGLAK